MGSRHYILIGQTPVEEPNLLVWAEWIEHADRQVALTHLPSGIEISTIFLGLDHNYWGGPPLLFETMTFHASDNIDHDSRQDRCSTWLEAEEMHKQMVKKMMGEK